LRPVHAPSAPAFGDPPSLRRRAASLTLAVAITLLILFGFFGLGGAIRKRPLFRGGPVLVDLRPDADSVADAPSPAAKARPRPKPAGPQPRPIPLVKLPPPPVPVPDPSPYILLSKEEYEAFERTTRPAPAPAPGAGQGNALATLGPGDSQPIGTAPNGEPLYAAQWYRKPSRAELSTYLPPNMPGEGWGMIACRTVARYHVDDCVELGSSPPGSHLAGAVRQAAWQFLVRPPRKGGKELVGSWVRIRIDYTTTVVAREAGPR
jgi:protein TonB